jgi:DNA (cytosine-5)-methyltransferase 1
MLRTLDLFSGIGGFSLGLERTGGFQTVAFCEIEPFCRRVLAKHWPEVPCYDDVRSLSAERLAADGIAVDTICGGFPCQDISVAGKGAGLAGERSGLWREYARLIGELRPRYVIVENVSALLGRGLDAVLGDLATLGYDAEWHCIPASAVGAPHRRDRVWIVAHSEGFGWRARGPRRSADASEGEPFPQRSVQNPHADSKPLVGAAISWPQHNSWHPEPAVDRVLNGVPARMVEDELRALGNAVVPQIPELIGCAILAAEVHP